MNTIGIFLCYLQPADDDSIVPCTPTLMTHRVDESYQAIGSPRVAPASTIRFQFEDVTQTPTSLAAMPGGLYNYGNNISLF